MDWKRKAYIVNICICEYISLKTYFCRVSDLVVFLKPVKKVLNGLFSALHLIFCWKKVGRYLVFFNSTAIIEISKPIVADLFIYHIYIYIMANLYLSIITSMDNYTIQQLFNIWHNIGQ